MPSGSARTRGTHPIRGGYLVIPSGMNWDWDNLAGHRLLDRYRAGLLSQYDTDGLADIHRVWTKCVLGGILFGVFGVFAAVS